MKKDSRRHNLLLSDLDGSNISCFFLLNITSFFSLPLVFHCFSIVLGVQLSKRSKTRCKYGQRHSLLGDNKWRLGTSSHDLLQPSWMTCNAHCLLAARPTELSRLLCISSLSLFHFSVFMLHDSICNGITFFLSHWSNYKVAQVAVEVNLTDNCSHGITIVT